MMTMKNDSVGMMLAMRETAASHLADYHKQLDILNQGEPHNSDHADAAIRIHAACIGIKLMWELLSKCDEPNASDN